MKNTLYIPVFLVLLVFVLALSGCGQDEKDDFSSTSTPTPTATPIPTPTSTSTLTPEVQTILPSSSAGTEVLYKFSDQKGSTTEEFSTTKFFKIAIHSSGSAITVSLKDSDGSARGIYNHPGSSRLVTGKTASVSPGVYSLKIECENNCEWTIEIESDPASKVVVVLPTTKAKQTGDLPTTDTKLEVDVSEWDMLSDSTSWVVLSSPHTQAITLDFDSDDRTVKVTGSAKAVPPKAHVMVANLELGDFVLVGADDEGSFYAKVDGHPGTHIMVKQDATGELFNLNDPDATHGPNTLRTIFPPGVLLRIPVQESENGVSFSSGGRLPEDEDAPWTIVGNLAQDQLTLGQEVLISGQVAILTDRYNPPPSSAQLGFELHLLINANGRQVGGARVFTTTLFTSTNLPIESKNSLRSLYSVAKTQLEWRFVGERWISDFSTIFTIDEHSPVGLYQLKAELSGVSGLPRTVPQSVLHRSFMQKAAIGTLVIGQPDTMRLTSTLLADQLSEGSRGGVVAREDKGYFDISHRAGIRHQPVIPRLDNYGKPWRYRLEPYIPMLGVVDRSPPAVPSIELDFSTSDLAVTVARPDGITDILGPAPLTDYAIKSPRTPWHKTVSEGGGNLGEVPQLQNDGEVFVYKFPIDGDYVVTLDGHISDFAGRLYVITGTYDVTVANIFDVEANLFPGTPFEVGDNLPVGLRLMPGFPAEIDYTVTYIAADGETTTRTFEGNANENGWWDGNGEAFAFERDGEYRVDIEARHTDEKGMLWVGRLRFGSAIATPNAPIILHGRRGPNGISEIPEPWGFSEDFKGTDADHMQFPFFSGDVLWGQNSGHLKDSVVILTSVQLLDELDPLIARVKKQAENNHLGISLGELIKAGQMPLSMDVKPGTVANATKYNDIDLWSYVYASVQRPGIRVREQILGDDIGGAYWRFDDAYHMQSGNGPQGDLPGDFKFMYAASVIRDPMLGKGIYAAYGSSWVLARDDDPMGARFMPPFQGAAGGPNGGPLFTVHGRSVDMFFHPLAVRPGSVFKVGEHFRMAGAIMPTLPSNLEYTVTSPDGTVRSFDGQANIVGYFYQPGDDFILDQAGFWTVKLKVVHTGMTSAGPVQLPYPTGGPLTPDGSTFSFIVAGPETEVLDIDTDLSQLTPAQWFGNNQEARFEMSLPTSWSIEKTSVIVSMPGIVLVDEPVLTTGDTVAWNLNAQELNHLANNFDYERGIADTIDVTFYVEGTSSGEPIQAYGTMITHGSRIANTPVFEKNVHLQSTLDSIKMTTDLPDIMSFVTNKTDQFLVDMDHVKGGHPFKGQGSKDPDDGAHVNFDNSGNQWPEGTAVTEFPPIYAVADGYVERIDTYEPVGEKNYKYGVHIAFAQKNGRFVKFHMSIEPSTDPGDSSFYEPFIIVKEGQSVRKGEIVAYMYLPPNGKYPGPHIHFSVQPDTESQQAPAIFNDELVEAFHQRWGDFRFDFKNSPVEGDIEMPSCMGYKLAAFENPFDKVQSECLK